MKDISKSGYQEKWIDLHIHTAVSDGNFSPEEVVIYAKKIGLSAIAIADHDSTEGIEAALRAGNEHGIEVIPAIELSAEPAELNMPELHFLGYWINLKNTKLQEHLTFFRDARKKRAFTILEKLSKLDVFLETEDLMRIADTSSIGRLHFAKALLEQKFVHNIHEAFDRYLAYGKPAYVQKPKVSAQFAIDLIIHAEGIPVLAHPLYGVENNANLLKTLASLGLKGLEVYHPKHSSSMTKMFEKQADELGLVKTGGSDCHGGINGNKPLMGSFKIPYSILDQLKQSKISHPNSEQHI